MLGVIGGSGFYTFFGPDARSISVDTPYGAPSGAITVGAVGEHEVAFLPRHGAKHEFSPHTVPYRANMWALRALGVRRIFAPCAVGSLTPDSARAPWWCPISWSTAPAAAPTPTSTPAASTSVSPTRTARRCAPRSTDLPGVVDGGTMVVIQGPRFSTRAESRGSPRRASRWST